ncbi:MAG TPA: PHP domain-containing protein [Chthoniobacterales bacterium]|nr:PHP domain-containing protein [Chthoniobacterales bacterium]
MSKDQAIHREGLRFKKLDLHLHTPASKCFVDRNVTADAIVKAALVQKLDGIAVTDHNSGAWVDEVKKAAAKTGLVVFPGVEITCIAGTGGIHLIALFDTSACTRDIESLLGNLGLKPEQYGNIDTLVKHDPLAVAAIIAQRGGLAILAHANSTKGALADMKGEQRTALVQCPSIKAAEGTDFQDAEAAKKRKRVVDLLDGTDTTYKRKLAVYQASDNPTAKADGHGLEGIGTRCSYFKLDQINIDGLGQCLADPDVRIRQDYEYAVTTFPYIERIKVTGGFLDGAEAIFHQGLNSILGAKGAGKSLLIEFLRFALNQQPSNKDILADHESKLAQRLENYGTVEVAIVDETGMKFVVSRVWDPAEDHPYTSDVRNAAEVFPILFLSQNEIIKIAESEDEQIAFIDRFFDFRSFRQKIADLDHKMEELDRALAESLEAFRTQKEIEEAITASNKELVSLDAKLKNPIFDEYTKQETKDRALREQQAFVDDLIKQLDTTRRDYGRVQVPALPETHASDPALRRVQDVNTQAKDSLLQGLEEAAAKLVQFKQQVETEYSKWLPDFLAAKKRYSDAVQKEGGDYKNLAQKRAKCVKQIETLQQRLVPIKQRSDQIKDISTERDETITALKREYEAYSKERQTRCQTIEQESGNRLKIGIQESSNVDEFRSRLNALKKGSYLKDAEINLICEKSDPGTFVKAVIRHEVFGKTQFLEALAKDVGIDRERMFVLSEFLDSEFQIEQLLSLEHKALPKDRPEILYNVGENKFEPLNRLSVGQKCTAMLIVALSDGMFPIVIDQPEDSLDIRTIWEDMCTKIRRGKEKRQFIFTTHNSSLAVASDTDKFTILEAGATSGKVMYSGSMDHSPVNEEVITYLEGGPDTYRTKFRKYRIDSKK